MMRGLSLVAPSSHAQRRPVPSLDLVPRTVLYPRTRTDTLCMAVYFLNRIIPPKHVSKMDRTRWRNDDVTIFLGHGDNIDDLI